MWLYAKQVFVFIERRLMSRPAIMHKMKNIITRYDNTILLQFILPTKDTGKAYYILCFFF